MTALRWLLAGLGVLNVLLGAYWSLVIAAASSVAQKEPERLATVLATASGWEPEELRPYMDPPSAAESPAAFGRAAAAPTQSVLDPLAFKLFILCCVNGVALIAASMILGRRAANRTSGAVSHYARADDAAA